MPDASSIAPRFNPDLNDDEDGDLCRVCRSEAEDSKPLIFPCKCSGSVRYVHSDCLQEWLSHSKKRHCEICGHHYTFTKVYPASIPSAIPTIVYVRQSLLAAGRIAMRMFRAWLAIVTWLIILPCTVMGCLRFILVGTDWLLWKVLMYGIRNAIATNGAELNATLSETNRTLDVNFTTANVTGRERVVAIIASNGTLPLPGLLKTISSDAENMIGFVFRGQIVVVAIAAIVIGLILLREWVGQHDWHTPPPVENDPQDIMPANWTFRDGRARRRTYENDSEYSESVENDRVSDEEFRKGEYHVDLDYGHEHGHVPRVATPDEDQWEDVPAEEVEQDRPEDSPSTSPIRPAPAYLGNHGNFDPANFDVSFIPPELLPSGSKFERAPIWKETAAAGPGPSSSLRSSSRPIADVPVDVDGTDTADPGQSQGASSSSAWTLGKGEPSTRGRQLTRATWPLVQNGDLDLDSPSNLDGYIAAALSRQERISPSEAAATPPETASSPAELATVVNASSAPDTHWDTRRASDPGPALGSVNVESPRVNRTFGSHGFALDVVPENPPQSLIGPEDSIDTRLLLKQKTPGSPAVNSSSTRSPSGSALATPPNGLGSGLARTDTEPDDGDGDIEDPEDDDDAVPDVVVGALGQAELIAAALGEIEPLVVNVQAVPEEEEDPPLDAEDWEGILEVIGFIGPLTGLLQNHIFVSMVMGVTLIVIVGLPLILGKLVLAVDPIRASSDLFNLMITVVKFVTDPIVEVFLGLAKDVVLHPLLATTKAVDWVFHRILHLPRIFEWIFTLASDLSVSFQGSISPLATEVSSASMLGGTATVFEVVGQNSHSVYNSQRLLAVSMAASTDVTDDFWCILVGYLTASILFALIAIADAAELVHFSESFMEKFRSGQVFLKVVCFMTLEIVMFPLFVGGMVDFCTMPLFGVTVAERLAQFYARLFGRLFFTWLVGTISMYSFATFLTHIRTICRRGALYFIRDPTDPAHSAIKEIIERPVLSQIPRLAISAAMYALVVIAVTGLTPFILTLGPFKGFLPVRLNLGPLSSVPYDLLFLRVVLPSSWESLRLYHRLKRGLAYWWTFTVRQIGLSSLIFGSQPPQTEEGWAVHFAWSVADFICQTIFGNYDNRESVARVPATDHIEMLPPVERSREGILITLDEKGVPRTEADKIRMLKQDRAARRAGRDPYEDYKVVHLPYCWRTRVYALIAAALLSAAATSLLLFAVPLLIGRQFTALVFDKPVVDGYSFIAGGYICWGSYTLGRNAEKRIIVWGRAARIRRSRMSTRTKRAILQAMRSAYSVIQLFIVLPLLVGINFELFIAMPARYGFLLRVTPVLHIWDAWAMGAALLSVYVGYIGYVGHGRVADDANTTLGMRLHEKYRTPFRHSFTGINQFVFPLIMYLLLPIILPWLTSVAVCLFIVVLGMPVHSPANGVSFRMVYPLTSAALLLYARRTALSNWLARAQQSIIDAEYVVEERVENYLPDSTVGVPNGKAVEEVIEEDEGGEGGEEWEDILEQQLERAGAENARARAILDDFRRGRRERREVR